MPTTPIYRTRTVWTGITGTPFLTTMYFDASSYAPSVAGDNAHAFWTELESVISSSLEWNVQAEIETVDPVTGNITAVTQHQNLSGLGGNATSLLALGTCGLLNLNSGVYVNGRAIRGKIYVPGPTEGSMDLGAPQTQYNTALTDAFATVQPPSGPEIVIYSPTNAQWQPVASASPSGFFARLRSRQR